MTRNDMMLQDFAQQAGVKTIEDLLYFPKYVQIETVVACNARCVMCPVEEIKRDEPIMTPELFDKILKELSCFSKWVNKVTIQWNGEPLLDKGLEDKIRTLKHAGMRYVSFATNAQLMDGKRAESILASGVDEVSFSLDSVSKDVFEKIRTRLSFEECVVNTENFIKIRDRLGASTRVRIRMTVQDKNVHEVGAFMQYWRKRSGAKDSVYGKLLHNWANWTKDYKLPSGAERSEVLNTSPCISPFGSLVICTDGRAALCCSDYNVSAPMGDFRRSSMQEIWQSAVFAKVRSDHRIRGRQSMPMCVDCNVWDSSAKIEAV